MALLLLGIDPGLARTGWGVIEVAGSRLAHVAHGRIETCAEAAMPARLLAIHRGLADVIAAHRPAEAAVELTFVSRDAVASLKLGHARGAALLALAEAGLQVGEYAPNLVKKSVVGAGHADKVQVAHMVEMLLGRPGVQGADAADALAVAITHAHHRAPPGRLRAGR
jgi:crossover junction endodeoxyribonuclease RuvC